MTKSVSFFVTQPNVDMCSGSSYRSTMDFQPCDNTQEKIYKEHTYSFREAGSSV